MKTKSVPYSWIQRWGLRLDTSPYMGGAVEARVILEKIRFKKEPLRSLTTGHKGGIYNGPMFRRNYVDSADHGVPFLTSGSMLKADLADLPYLRRVDAESNKLSFLQLSAGTTMISCSGTIGRMIYARPDMENMWASQDILKVVPDKSKIQSGYLHSFLTSKFGVPLITSGTYGAIIQHIEAEHIADLPVPRLGSAIEQKSHELVETAAEKRVQAARLLAKAKDEFLSLLGKRPLASSILWMPVPSTLLKERCDAYYFSPKCTIARNWFDASECESKPLHEVAHVTMPGIFKRLYANDPQLGVPYITGGDVFELNPSTNRYLMKRVAKEYGLQVSRGMILIQEAGQLGGLIGKSVQVGDHLDGFAVSNNMVRVLPKEEADAGYIFTVLSSEPGVTLISREAAGSSIPHLDAARVRNLAIPWAKTQVRQKIGALAIEARTLRDQAIEHDRDAKLLVEKAIEEAV
jgi:type I restriction enzyme S subunit